MKKFIRIIFLSLLCSFVFEQTSFAMKRRRDKIEEEDLGQPEKKRVRVDIQEPEDENIVNIKVLLSLKMKRVMVLI